MDYKTLQALVGKEEFDEAIENFKKEVGEENIDFANFNSSYSEPKNSGVTIEKADTLLSETADLDSQLLDIRSYL